ncbi:hypothetical protein KGF64_14850 [Lactiplantibacillus plantarum]|uniref:Uncharacterized protein n=1 Tax=Lactiplantibacillus paraplantarum TaxID=60520 RepID=A0ABQ0NDQ1_9LACO|nr:MULTISPECIES: hypothetical protein [Lactiplantibacillus]APD02899.1 hypothetical protein ASV54_16145 [Lactiplantibacillus plantarum]MBU7468994.1 hypothetical protein [Lactiplantibacillus plantarum]MBU8890946.1 hypothetical protein [Lactiplantibacillus plantarum]MDT7023316.1 hypothetical protein [Lactiplantibacillus plantarum]GBF03205.1 hypothetical protein LPPLD21_02760 [Lactiplantibacillus paraplantarum]
MDNAIIKKDILLNLSVEDGGFDFSTSIADAIAKAETELVVLNETVDSIKGLKPDCDKLDYILATSSGALCGIIDIFLVGKPGESPLGNITDKWFVARTIDFAKLCDPEKKNFDSLDSALRFLEKKFKVPYDQTGLGDAGKTIFDLTAKNHHFKSLAHNPSLLGLFFSILDQFSNTSHFVTDGQLVSLQQADEKWELRGGNIPSKLFCGFANWIGHLISDVSGSSSSAAKGNRGTGLPSPLWTWTNDIIAIKAKLGLSVTETDKAMNELALNIFEKGYDIRFQTAQAIPVFLNELLVRLIYAIRRLFRYFSEIPKTERSFALMWKKCEPFSNATVKRMLSVAHGTFCLVDVGDAVSRSLIAGGGTFNAVEFVLRLNVVGVGRFAISLYGETRRAISYNHAKKEFDFASKETVIVSNYIEGLKILAHQYDDHYLLMFISDFEKSDAYIEAFGKSVTLAEVRNVPVNRILKSKPDIDKYFGGK